MRRQKLIPIKTTDGLLKSMLVLARTVDSLLEGRAFTTSHEPLSRSKVQILRLLHQRGPQSATRMAQFLGVSKPAVTQIVDSLIQSRLVRRRRIAHDRRGVALSLTAKGRRIAEIVRNEQRHLVRNALRRTPPRTSEQWIHTLQLIAGALARADRAFQHFCLQCGAHADGTCVLVGGDAVCPFLRHTAHRRRMRTDRAMTPQHDRPGRRIRAEGTPHAPARPLKQSAAGRGTFIS